MWCTVHVSWAAGRTGYSISGIRWGIRKIAKRRLRIYEVGIGYWGRTYEEGKKIGWKDGVRALWCLLKYAITEPTVQKRSVEQDAPVLANTRGPGSSVSGNS